MEGDEGTYQSPPPLVSAAMISAVLGDNDLLGDILVHLGFPTSLVHTSLVAKRWLRITSDPAFLCRFRELHPPRILGFFFFRIFGSCSSVAYYKRSGWQFEPIVEAPELATTVDHAMSLRISHQDCHIIDCRNGRTLVEFLINGTSRYVVVNPLHPTHDFVLLRPQVPKLGGKGWIPNYNFYHEHVFLSNNGASIILVVLQNAKEIISVQVYSLQSGEWGISIMATIELRGQTTQILNIFPPINGKLYIVIHSGCILVLELATGHFFAIELPGRVVDNLTLSCGDDSGLFLIHAKGLQLSIWHRKIINGDDTSGWLLVNEVCECEACDHLEGVSLVGSGDNAEFVFMRLTRSGALVSVNLRTKVEKIYEGVMYGNVFPLMMVWPAIFPMINEGNNQEQ